MSAEKLRVTIVTPQQSGGGAEYQIQCLIEALLESSSHQVSLLVRHIEEPPRPTAYRLLKIGRGNDMPRLGYTMDALPLYRALRRMAPHVIYQRVACGYTGICAWYARRHGARMIWHVASDADLSRHGIAAGRNPLRPFLEKRSIEYAVRHAGQIVVQTQHQAQVLQRTYARSAAAVIPNFHPQPKERIDKAGWITVIWIANFKPLKQPEAFVRLAAQLSDLADVRFVMVGAPARGSGDHKWSTALMASIEATPNLEYLGEKSQDEVNELLARAHIYVNTSLFEGFANTFIQAWMRDVAVVSLYVNPDSVFDREGVGIHAGSEDELARAVRRLIADATLRSGYVLRGQRYAAQSHSMQNVQRLIQLIDASPGERSLADARPGAPFKSGS
jgi:glycosyltransferase involved in cell wall biosynthesis